jgi:endogenous inhibitor of DNA gyrase (YacG/DUF329 family)
MPPTVCPICKKPVADAPANANYPFCCDRCKLIDLGRWLDGKYAIPVKARDEMVDETAEFDREEET